MSRPGLAGAWIIVALLFLVLLAVEAGKWGSGVLEGRRVAAKKSRLTAEISAKNQEIAGEMQAQSALLREMKWSADPSAFLGGLAELIQGARLQITAIGPLQQEAAPQFVKSWHTVQVVAPYRDLVDLATRIERERGFLEDVLLELPKPGAGAQAAGGPEIQARFKVTAVELSPEAKGIVQRVMVTSPGAPGAPVKPEPSLALPLRPGREQSAAPVRDPFTFVATAPPARPPRMAAGPMAHTRGEPGPEIPEPAAPLEVKGIVSFPGGTLAIVNAQIVKVGDRVEGHRVERITDTEVVLRQPDGARRTLRLANITQAAPATPKR